MPASSGYTIVAVRATPGTSLSVAVADAIGVAKQVGRVFEFNERSTVVEADTPPSTVIAAIERSM